MASFFIFFLNQNNCFGENLKRKAFGVAFGSPGLISLRYQQSLSLQTKDSMTPFSFQLDLSDQVLFHNRSNGRLKMIRSLFLFEKLNQFHTEFDALTWFQFLGIDYFTGYYDRYSPQLKLFTLEVGGCVELKVSTGNWFLSGELGALIPTRFESGFENVGIVSNLGILRKF